MSRHEGRNHTYGAAIWRVDDVEIHAPDMEEDDGRGTAHAATRGGPGIGDY